jgi:hypothetical protein
LFRKCDKISTFTHFLNFFTAKPFLESSKKDKNRSSIFFLWWNVIKVLTRQNPKNFKSNIKFPFNFWNWFPFSHFMRYLFMRIFSSNFRLKAFPCSLLSGKFVEIYSNFFIQQIVEDLIFLLDFFQQFFSLREIFNKNKYRVF